jgi:ComF family protein
VLAPPADDLVHALKYEGWPELASVMGADMVRAAPRTAAGASALVVPIPTTARRLKRRGYNQAELLAQEVAGRLGLPLLRALARHGEGPSQTDLSPAERRENVRGAFVPARTGGSDVQGADVLLVDDVLTTGATAGEAAEVLARMGVRSVTALAFARALPSTVRRPP